MKRLGKQSREGTGRGILHHCHLGTEVEEYLGHQNKLLWREDWEVLVLLRLAEYAHRTVVKLSTRRCTGTEY